MRNSIIFLSVFCIIMTSILTSCINEDYNLDNIDKQMVFSQDGLNIPIGNFDKIFLDFDLEGDLEKLVYQHDFEGFFTEELYERFIIKKNGKEEGIGYLEFTADFSAFVKNDKGQITINALTQALDYRGEPVIEMGNNDMFANNNEDRLEVQPFTIKIEQEDIIKMKKANVLRFTFTVDPTEVNINREDDNYVNINNMRIKSSGGISFEL